MSERSEQNDHSRTPDDAEFSTGHDVRQGRSVPHEAGARRTYLLESAAVAHGRLLVGTLQPVSYQGELLAFDPVGLRGRIESEHLAEAAVDTLESMPVRGTRAVHKGGRV